MEIPRAADVVPMKLREDLDKNNAALYVANLKNIATKEALKKLNVAFHIINMEITEFQVDYNTISGILDDTEDDLRDMNSDLHATQKKIKYAKSDLMCEKLFNGLEAEDAKQEVTDAKQKTEDVRREGAEARKEKRMLDMKQRM
jgi:predicted  nucleic acid-binding Zn-ribbon protein